MSNDQIKEIHRQREICHEYQKSLEKILEKAECLDELAMTLNILIRRLFCHMFTAQTFQDLFKEKIESKLKEISVKRIRCC